MQSPRKLRTLLAGGAVAAAAVGGIATLAGAQSDSSPSTSAPADESGESAALQSQAKITPDQAKQAALAAVPGTADKVELENENGTVVYGVEVTDSAGQKTDVKVDAGNGSVVSKEVDTENDNGAEGANEKADANETPDANEPAASSTTGG